MASQTHSCDLCDYETTDKSNYTKHMNSKKHLKKLENKPEELEVYNCDECDYSTSNKSNLTRHMKTHEGITTKTFKCEACDMYFKDKAHLRTHCGSHAHHQNVHVKFPDTIDTTRVVAFPVKLDLSKRDQYIKKVNVDVPITKTMPKTTKKENDMIDVKQFIDPSELDEKLHEKLVQKAIKWMKANDIDPADEGLMEDEISDSYNNAYKIFAGNPKEYFSNTMGIEFDF